MPRAQRQAILAATAALAVEQVEQKRAASKQPQAKPAPDWLEDVRRSEEK